MKLINILTINIGVDKENLQKNTLVSLSLCGHMRRGCDNGFFFFFPSYIKSEEVSAFQV